MHISTLSYYPIKSCKGWEIGSARVTERGFENDRIFMLVDKDGDFMTQRQTPKMALIHPVINANTLKLNAPGQNELTISISRLGKKIPIQVWSHTGEAVDQGDLAAEWFSEFLGSSVRLVRMGDDYIRKVNPEFAVKPGDHISFADGYPILIATQSGLDDLNSRLASPLPMNRFRPNIVVADTAPFEEDKWKRIRIGKVELAIVKPCARCEITTTDQVTTERTHEPLKTLATFRRIEDNKVIFGQNVIPINAGVIKVGDKVEVLNYKD